MTNPCLRYHGGQVLHNHAAYLIFWQPSNGSGSPNNVSPFPTSPDYKTAINTYMANVAAASGALDNVYSVATQYSDAIGFASYGVSFPTQPPVDTDPLPASGCSYTAMAGHACMTDSQLQNEIDSFVQSKGLPRGLGAVYFLVTPPGLASCFSSDTTQGCYNEASSGRGYCAYHGAFNIASHGLTLYANMPFADTPLCQTGNSPPDHPNNSSADDWVSIASHEQIETMTDPLAPPLGTGAWYNNITGEEIGDVCAIDYGTALGSVGGAPYNQSINGGKYELQTEWSNQANDCSAALPTGPPQPPTVSLAPLPGPYYQAAPVNFSASSRSGMTYAWDFGDGTTASSSDRTAVGSSGTSHIYVNPGTYKVTVTTTDPASNAVSAPASAMFTVQAALPVAAFALSPGAPTSGQQVSFDGRGSSDAHGGGIIGYQWSFGDGALDVGPLQRHTYATPGTYSVTLTVTNSLGQSATATQSVAVAPDPVVVKISCRDQLGQTLQSALGAFGAGGSLSWLTSPVQVARARPAATDAVLAYSISRVKGGEILATVTGTSADPVRELKALKACAGRCCGLPSQGCSGSSRRLLAAALQGLLKVGAKRKHGFVVVHSRHVLPASCQAPPTAVGQRLSLFVLRKGHRTELLQIQLA